jgi:hypothetical protein
MHGYETQEVSESILIVQRVLRTVNDAIKDQELQEAHADLVARVRDWKNHRPENFGQLLLFDDLNVVTDKLGGRQITVVTVCYHCTKSRRTIATLLVMFFSNHLNSIVPISMKGSSYSVKRIHLRESLHEN